MYHRACYVEWNTSGTIHLWRFYRLSSCRFILPLIIRSTIYGTHSYTDTRLLSALKLASHRKLQARIIIYIHMSKVKARAVWISSFIMKRTNNFLDKYYIVREIFQISHAFILLPGALYLTSWTRHWKNLTTISFVCCRARIFARFRFRLIVPSVFSPYS